MKIYLFNPETGCYLGEDFADEGTGPCRIPSDATAVAPPEAGPGQIAVFDPLRKMWTVKRLPRPASFQAGEPPPLLDESTP